MKQEEACFFPHLGSMLLQVGLEEDGSDPLPRVMFILSHGFNFPFLNSSQLASEKHNIPFAGIIFLNVIPTSSIHPLKVQLVKEKQERSCALAQHAVTLAAAWKLSLGEEGLRRSLDLRRRPHCGLEEVS